MMPDRADAIERFLSEPDEHEKLVAMVKGAPQEAQAIMRRHGLKIESFEDPMQKLAFTFYTMLVEHAHAAEALEDAMADAPNANSTT
jgi:hypothetical protein